MWVTFLLPGNGKKVGQEKKRFLGLMTDMTPDPIKSPAFPMLTQRCSEMPRSCHVWVRGDLGASVPFQVREAAIYDIIQRTTSTVPKSKILDTDR